jgi:hypothetical protein
MAIRSAACGKAHQRPLEESVTRLSGETHAIGEAAREANSYLIQRFQ